MSYDESQVLSMVVEWCGIMGILLQKTTSLVDIFNGLIEDESFLELHLIWSEFPYLKNNDIFYQAVERGYSKLAIYLSYQGLGDRERGVHIAYRFGHLSLVDRLASLSLV